MKRIVVFALVLNAALLGVIAHQLVAIAGDGVFFADDFARNNGDPGDWTPLGNNWPRNQGNWRIENQRLVVTWLRNDPLVPGNRAGSRSTWLWAGDPPLTLPEEFELTFDIEFGGIPDNGVGRFGGITFCTNDPSVPGIGGTGANGYQLEWRDISLPDEESGHHGFTLFDAQGAGLIARGGGHLANPPRQVRIVVDEANIEIWGDGELLIQVENSNNRQGHFGFFGAPWRGSIVFDNVVVQDSSGNLCEDCDPVDIRPGQSLTGDLGTSVCRDDDEGPVAIFALQVDADFSGTLSVTSDNFNPSLSFYNDFCDEVARNNVCRIAEADACLRVDLEPGTYTLSVRSQDPEVTGNFSISVSEMEEVEIFSRGDANADSQVDLSDAVFLLNFLFLGAGNPLCPDAADINDDGGLDLSDAVYLLNRLFLGGLEIAFPGLFECGADPTGDDLDCGRFPPCDL